MLIKLNHQLKWMICELLTNLTLSHYTQLKEKQTTRCVCSYILLMQWTITVISLRLTFTYFPSIPFLLIFLCLPSWSRQWMHLIMCALTVVVPTCKMLKNLFIVIRWNRCYTLLSALLSIAKEVSKPTKVLKFIQHCQRMGCHFFSHKVGLEF